MGPGEETSEGPLHPLLYLLYGAASAKLAEACGMFVCFASFQSHHFSSYISENS